MYQNVIYIYTHYLNHSFKKVLDWLLSYNAKFRINDTSFLVDVINESLAKNKFDNTSIVLWFNGINIDDSLRQRDIPTNNLTLDIDSIFKTFAYLNIPKTIYQLGNIDYDNCTTKINNLKHAKNAGLKVPFSKIITTKKELIKFKERYVNIITKSLNDNFAIKRNNLLSMGYRCNTVTEDVIENMGDIFAPSLLQEEIKKEFEIRIFYLNKTFFSMAIFSQSDKKTSVDFRNYNLSNPNRCVPFTLPKSVEKRLEKLLEKVELNMASIDMIYNDKKKYVFLEINPVGQWGFVSTNCNYNIEKQIAIFLNITHD